MRTLASWAKAIDVGMRDDGMTLEGCKTVIDVAHRNKDTFWRDKFGCGKKVRDKYEDFLIRAKTTATSGRPTAGYGLNYGAIGARLDKLCETTK